MPRREDPLVEALVRLSPPIVGIGLRSVEVAAGGVTMPQYRALVLLHDNGPLTIGTIAVELGVNPSNATRVADRLERLGLITRRPSSRDRRTVLAEVTGAGEDVVRAVTTFRRAELARVVARLDGARSEELVRALSEVADAARTVEAVDLAGQRG